MNTILGLSMSNFLSMSIFFKKWANVPRSPLHAAGACMRPVISHCKVVKPISNLIGHHVYIIIPGVGGCLVHKNLDGDVRYDPDGFTLYTQGREVIIFSDVNLFRWKTEWLRITDAVYFHICCSVAQKVYIAMITTIFCLWETNCCILVICWKNNHFNLGTF